MSNLSSPSMTTSAQDVNVPSTSDVPTVFSPVQRDDPVISLLLGLPMGISRSPASDVEVTSAMPVQRTPEQPVSSSPRISAALPSTRPVPQPSRSSTPWNPATRLGLERMRLWVRRHVPIGRQGRMYRMVRELHYMARDQRVENNPYMANLLHSVRSAVSNPRMDALDQVERRCREAAPFLRLNGSTAQSPVSLAEAMRRETSMPGTPQEESEVETETDSEATSSTMEEESQSSDRQASTDQEDDSSPSEMSIGTSPSSSPMGDATPFTRHLGRMARQETPAVPVELTGPAIPLAFYAAERQRLQQRIQHLEGVEMGSRRGYRSMCNSVASEMSDWVHQLREGQMNFDSYPSFDDVVARSRSLMQNLELLYVRHQEDVARLYQLTVRRQQLERDAQNELARNARS